MTHQGVIPIEALAYAARACREAASTEGDGVSVAAIVSEEGLFFEVRREGVVTATHVAPWHQVRDALHPEAAIDMAIDRVLGRPFGTRSRERSGEL